MHKHPYTSCIVLLKKHKTVHKNEKYVLKYTASHGIFKTLVVIKLGLQYFYTQDRGRKTMILWRVSKMSAEGVSRELTDPVISQAKGQGG